MLCGVIIMKLLIRERNGIEETWYSDKYFIEQLKLAYQAGIHRGIKVEFHAVIPMDDRNVEDLTDVFKKRVQEEYEKAYSNSEIISIG